jgi:hypothetical protein
MSFRNDDYEVHGHWNLDMATNDLTVIIENRRYAFTNIKGKWKLKGANFYLVDPDLTFLTP